MKQAKTRWAILAAMCVAGAAQASAALSATAQISPKQLDPTTYEYDLTLNNTGTTNVGTFWFAWVPGRDFLDTSPINGTVATPSGSGWNLIGVTHGGSTDGYAVRWEASSVGNALASGSSLSGFSFESHDTPAQVFANSNFFPTTPVPTSFVYSGTAFSDSGFQFVATQLPEPSSAALLALAGMGMLRRRRARI